MRRTMAGLVALFAVSLALGALPQDAAGQRRPPDPEECSRCTKCKKCVGSKWGGNYCTMKGGCCKEKGGNCNPTMAMDTEPGDRMLIRDELTVRLAGNLFGTWNCEDDRLRVAYAVGGDGEATPVSESVLADLRGRYTLALYLQQGIYRELRAGVGTS